MKIDVYFTPLGVKEGDLAGRGVVVIDALRAATTIVAAIASGAKSVVPAASSEEAIRMTANLERDGFLLAGERRSLRIEGFALGNSPREMTPAAVAGRTIFLTTTNGTPALVAAHGGEPVLVGAAVNFSALAARARETFLARGDLAILCAGREHQFALEDAYTAGRLIKAVRRSRRRMALNDAATVALTIADRYRGWEPAFHDSAAARQLAEVELQDDVAFAATEDRFRVVPVYANRRIT